MTTRASDRELVLCVEADAFESAWPQPGLIAAPKADCLRLLEDMPVWFAPRPEVEADERFLQLIPYVVLSVGFRVLGYRRGRSGGERRLHDRWSLGFGGHVALSDAVLTDGRLDFASTLRTTARREVEEELGPVPETEQDFLGLIRLADSQVSRCHVAIAELWTLAAQPSATTREECIADLTHIDRGQLHEWTSRLEGWSVVCAEALRCEPRAGTSSLAA